jgi:peptidoglycan/LPS O-acetylase OafA/YrhL
LPAKPNTSRAGPARRLVFVDLLRGLACLWVLYCHFHASWLGGVRHYGWDLETFMVRVAGFGGKGVDLFVVLSGFCLYYPMLQRDPSAPRVRVRSFYARRARRILPVYYVVIVASIAMVSVPAFGGRLADYRGLSDAVPYLLLVQSYLPGYIGRINGPLWSVALECQLYLLMPVWVWMFRRYGPTPALGAAAALSLAACGLSAAGRSWDSFDPFSDFGLPARSFQFVVGMATARLVRTPRPIHRPAAIAAFAVTLPLAVVSLTGRGPALLSATGTLFWGVCFASLVLMASHFESRRVFRHVAWAPLAWIGLISYSVYAIHFPVMLIAGQVLDVKLDNIGGGFARVTLVGIPIVVGSGYLVYLMVERFSVPAVRRQPLVGAVSSPDNPLGPADSLLADSVPAASTAGPAPSQFTDRDTVHEGRPPRAGYN